MGTSPQQPQGSSPRMRGAQFPTSDPHVHPGIIPADAGSTCPTCSRPATREDHPRGCGEHCTFLFPGSADLGSSPRMRGAHGCGGASSAPEGIIPADAGSTSISPVSISIFWDHPRGCGEHSGALWLTMLRAGSSPRMRGAPHRPWPDGSEQRIIPADAGSTYVWRCC